MCSVFELRYSLTTTIPKHGGDHCRVELSARPIPLRRSADGGRTFEMKMNYEGKRIGDCNYATESPEAKGRAMTADEKKTIMMIDSRLKKLEAGSSN